MHGHSGWHFWLIGFGLTLCLEAPVILWLLQDYEAKVSRRIGLLLFANLITHPLVWFFFPELPLSPDSRLWLSEAWAFAAEAGFYCFATPRLALPRAALISATANGLSFSVGWLIVHQWGRVLFRI
jgi:hypothetical protein